MGTVLSFPPNNNKNYNQNYQSTDNHNQQSIASTIKKHNTIFLSGLSWKRVMNKKTLMNQNQHRIPLDNIQPILNNEYNINNNYKNNCNKNLQQSLLKHKGLDLIRHQGQPQPQSNQPNQQIHNIKYIPKAILTNNPLVNNNNKRTTIIQASTSELLKCLSLFVKTKFKFILNLQANNVILWLRNVDRNLLLQGWQDIGFINPANLVFIYLLLRNGTNYNIKPTKNNIHDNVNCNSNTCVWNCVKNENELHSYILTCLYLSYSYMGNEISYPIKPFLVDNQQRDVFWDRCLNIINYMSRDMLRINAEPTFFTEIFSELKSIGMKY